jgi:hypothetical protein
MFTRAVTALVALAMVLVAGPWSGVAPARPLLAQDTRGAQVIGTVIDVTTREPIPNARVSGLARIWPYRDRTAVVTDADGRFTLSDLAGPGHTQT